jgi:hypothetical protein
MFARLVISALHSAFWSALLDPVFSRHWHGDVLLLASGGLALIVFLFSLALFQFAVDRLRECDEQ